MGEFGKTGQESYQTVQHSRSDLLSGGVSGGVSGLSGFFWSISSFGLFGLPDPFGVASLDSIQ
jgi:hypothetical protein